MTDAQCFIAATGIVLGGMALFIYSLIGFCRFQEYPGKRDLNAWVGMILIPGTIGGFLILAMVTGIRQLANHLCGG